MNSVWVRRLMSIRSHCFVITGLRDAEVASIREIAHKERLQVKIADLKNEGGVHLVEIVAADEGTMKFIKAVFDKKFPSRKLAYAEEK